MLSFVGHTTGKNTKLSDTQEKREVIANIYLNCFIRIYIFGTC